MKCCFYGHCKKFDEAICFDQLLADTTSPLFSVSENVSKQETSLKIFI